MKSWPWLAILLLTIYLILAAITTQIFHFSRALDEGYHLELITFIKQHNRLPVSYEERAQITKSDYPPLYHIIVALLSNRVDIGEGPDFKYFWDSFRYRVVDHQTEDPWTLDTEDFQWPYQGQFLVWQSGRWFSVFLSVGTIIVVFFTLQDIPLGQKPLTSLFGAALLAFTPRYLISGSSLNDDNLLGLLAALYFWMLVKAVKKPARWWPFVLMGVLLGISITVKYSVALVPLEVIAVLGLIAYRNKLGWWWGVKRLGIVGLPAILCASWWFGWSIWHFNTIAQDGWFVGLIRALFFGGYDITLNKIGEFLSGGAVGVSERVQNVSSGTFSGWVYKTFLTFWGYQANGAYPFYPYSYIIIILILIVAGVGLWRLWYANRQVRVWLGLTTFHFCLFFVLPLLRFSLTRRIGETAQGRHILIPAATAVVALIGWGLATVVPQRWHKIAFTVIIVLNIGWFYAHLYRLVEFSHPPLPVRTIAQAAERLAEPVNIQFGDGIELVSYEIDLQPQSELFRLNLAWRSLAYVNENYLLQVVLVNDVGDVVTQWVGYSGNGRFPTLAWTPGDSVFDRLTLPLPNLSPGEYTVRIQLVGQNGLVPAMTAIGEESDYLPLTQISLAESTAFSFPQTAGPMRFAVWNAHGPIAGDDVTVRYPGTISIVSGGEATVQLVDPSGQVWPPVAAQNNVHLFVVGPRWQSGAYQIQLMSPHGETALSDTTVHIENWWERTFEVPPIETPLEANFANQLLLLGYKLPQNQVQAGESFPITLYWQAMPNKSPQANFIQFNNLLDAGGIPHGGYERRPLEYYSTLLWAPGEIVSDGYVVPVDSDAPPGEYYLDVGYYITVGESAVNLPLVVDGEMTDVTSVTVGPIEVIAR